MGYFFTKTFKIITMFNSILMIIYCFFHPDLGEFQFMFIIMILLLISWIVWLTGKILSYFTKNKHHKEMKLKKNSILRIICLKFHQEVEMIYSVFLAIYLLFYRHSTSVAYLTLLLFGLYLGNKIAVRTNQYIRGSK